MQSIPPALLSTSIFNNDAYVLKEMQPAEDKIRFTLVRDDYADVGGIIRDMALLTSSAQLRSSGRQGSACADELIAFGGNNNWQAAIFKYALSYAGKVKKDYMAFVQAREAGFFHDND